MFIAGGTDLVPNLKRRQFDATTLISLNALPDGRLVEGDVHRGVTIGAQVTLDELARHHRLGSAFRALAQACGSVSTPQVRYMGTLGGNLLVDPRCNYYNQTYSWRKAVGFCLKKDGDICLVARSSPRCWAVSSSDSAPVALALGAEVTLQGTGGTRRIAAAALYRDDGIDYTTKRPEEVIREARGALGAVGSHPVDITAFLAPLEGARPTEDLIAEVAEAADKPSRPLDNTDLSHYWRKRMTKVYIERALRDACGLEPLGGRLTAQVRSGAR